MLIVGQDTMTYLVIHLEFYLGDLKGGEYTAVLTSILLAYQHLKCNISGIVNFITNSA